MKWYNNLLVGAMMLGLSGCPPAEGYKAERTPPIVAFDYVEVAKMTGMAAVSGDFTGDGHLDLLVGAKIPGKYKGRISLHEYHKDSNTFLKPVEIARVKMAIETGMDIASGDFDGDGDLDFIVVAKAPGEAKGMLYRFNNDGRGGFFQ